jgi:transcriptional regulator with XRE-family HTH domain
MSSFRFDGDRIRHARESLDPPKSRAQVAAEAGISLSYVSLIELNYRTPPIETLVSVCRACDIPVDFCFVEVEAVQAVQ